MDLFAVAQSNAPTLTAKFTALITALPTAPRGAVERFTNRVRDEGRISINMRPSEFLSFLVSSKHKNVYEWAEARASRSTKAAPEIIRERLGPYYERRMTFDGFFVDGDKFRYGALNIGGAGASRYGAYCSVVNETFARKPQVAYLRSDSLKTYLLPGPRVDGAAVERDAAPHSHRHCLAVVKHVDDVVALDDVSWPALVCNDDEFIEAVFVGNLGADDIERVRMPKGDHDALYDLAFEDFHFRLGEADKIEIGTFVLILDELAKRGIRLEVV